MKNKEIVNKKILDGKKRTIVNKIEDLNCLQASLRRRTMDLEKQKNDLSESKYQRRKEKFSKKLEKIREKIHTLESELENIKHSG
jgi:hypothetical protein